MKSKPTCGRQYCRSNGHRNRLQAYNPEPDRHDASSCEDREDRYPSHGWKPDHRLLSCKRSLTTGSYPALFG